jgi:hypothetical protein
MIHRFKVKNGVFEAGACSLLDAVCLRQGALGSHALEAKAFYEKSFE